MILKIILVNFFATAALLAGISSVQAADADALFADSSLLKVTVTAPFQQIMEDRPEEEYVPATLEYTAPDGSTRNFDIGIRTRGEFRRRRDICPFAPLRFNFQKKQVDETIFDEQDKLKVVTHCRSGSKRYGQTVVAEYLAYRILNLMTEKSFRARLMQIEYVYADDPGKTVDTFAFFIEHDDRFAKRLELTELEVPKIGIHELDAEHTNLVSVFQYLIGHSDFSPVSGPTGEMCCHNYVVFGEEEPPFWSIPYDFDLSGIVNAPHAVTNPRFGLRNVRHRLYRGRCINRDILPSTIELYRAKRGEIEALINNQEGLENGTRKSILTFLAGFYRVTDKEKLVDSQLVKACI
jgi:hypothetical protein